MLSFLFVFFVINTIIIPEESTVGPEAQKRWHIDWTVQYNTMQCKEMRTNNKQTERRVDEDTDRLG